MLINQIYNMDCLLGIQKMLEHGIQVDLIVADPPYYIKSTKAGGHSELSRSIQPMNDQLAQNKLTAGIDDVYLKAMWDVMKVPNIYIWCNGAQIPQYIDFFVKQRKCKMDMIIWRKTNATPLFCNKYLSDKEYCLYFRRGAYCQPRFSATSICRIRNTACIFGAARTANPSLTIRQRPCTICLSILKTSAHTITQPLNRCPSFGTL